MISHEFCAEEEEEADIDQRDTNKGNTCGVVSVAMRSSRLFWELVRLIDDGVLKTNEKEWCTIAFECVLLIV